MLELQGSDIVDTPELPGIYAWYYRPRVFGGHEAETLGKLITNPSHVKTEIALRYGLIWAVDSDVDVVCSSQQKRQLAHEMVSDAVINGDDSIKSFFQNLMVPYFAKPLYIGTARHNLRKRIKKHYDTLTQLWDSNTSVSRYLARNPNAPVEKVLAELELVHSFAIHARIKGLSPRDLVVCVCPLDDVGELKTLERILQLLADPICGKR